jgi:hypothetical protein
MRTEIQYVPCSAQDIWAVFSATARELRPCGLIVASSLRLKAGLFTTAASSKMLPECCQEPNEDWPSCLSAYQVACMRSALSKNVVVWCRRWHGGGGVGHALSRHSPSLLTRAQATTPAC